MKDSSIYFIEMQNRIDDVKNNADYQTEIADSDACTTMFATSSVYRTDSLGLQQKLLKSSRGHTLAGLEIKNTAATDFSITAGVMKSYGETINNSVLKGLSGYTFSDLFKKSPVDLVGDCKYILELIEEHATGLEGYKIDADYTSDLETVVTQLEALSKLPKAVIIQHANDNKKWNLHEKKVRKYYDTVMDPFMEIYRKFNIDLYLAYVAGRKVRHHHLKRKPTVPDTEITTGILELLVLFKTSMEPAAGANFVAAALNLSEIMDVDGELYADELAPGTYQGQLSMEGYTAIDFEFVIIAGETTAMQFLLEAV